MASLSLLSIDDLLAYYVQNNPDADIPPSSSLSISAHGDMSLLHHLRINLSYPALELVHASPPIFLINNFLSEKLCTQTIKYALNGRGMLTGRSKTFGSVSTVRSSTSWFLQRSDVKELLQQAEALLGISMLHFEVAQVARYMPGQEYSWHLDYIPSSSSEPNNRVATLLVYLNSPDGGGGETCFRDLGVSITPTIGKALLFFPCFNSGIPDFRTIHNSTEATDIKYIAQLWVRKHEFTEPEAWPPILVV